MEGGRMYGIKKIRGKPHINGTHLGEMRKIQKSEKNKRGDFWT